MSAIPSAPPPPPSPLPTLRRLGLVALALVVGFGLGFGLGVRSATVAVPPQRDGAFFCCDQAGKPCVHSPDGDCKVPLVWCPEVRRLDDGTVVCASK